MQGTSLDATRKTKMNQQNQNPCPQKAPDPGGEVNTGSSNEVQSIYKQNVLLCLQQMQNDRRAREKRN